MYTSQLSIYITDTLTSLSFTYTVTILHMQYLKLKYFFHQDPYDDYLEMFVQFGYVYLFAAVYPMAAFWAVLNNILEMRCDAFKLCCVYQRPIARKVKDTGAWQVK